MSEESVLLKIKRRYNKEESLSFVLDKLKNARFKIGELESEIAELKYKHKGELDKLNLEIKRLKEVPTSNGKTKKQWSQDEMFKHLNYENHVVRDRNKELKKENVRLRDQYLSLLAKIAKEKTEI